MVKHKIMENLPDPSQPLTNARHEGYAQLMAKGQSSVGGAYRIIYGLPETTKETTLAQSANRVHTRPAVQARIAWLKSQVTADWVFSVGEARRLVLEDARDVLLGDPSDLITYRRLNCRHCHGMNHAYRWRDEAEFWAALAAASDAQNAWDDAAPDRRPRKRPELPTDEGGYGFRELAPPYPACPKCEGEGIPEARVADIRTLSGPSRRLYAGLEVKKDGAIKVVMRDKEAARTLLARYAGVLVDKVQHSGVVALAPLQLTEDEKAAIRLALEKDI